VGADVPEAVTVTLYVLDCCPCEPFDDVAQPVSVSRKTASSIQRTLRRWGKKSSEIGETRARNIPDGIDSPWPLVVAPSVIFVLWGALPDNVEGAKLQLQPLGKPEQAKEREALNPFSGATETVNDPDAPCAIAREALDKVRP
jgi:hypothetical protein